MPIIKTTPSYSPKCPNHGVALEGCGFPLPAKGTGRCPVSGAGFDFEAELHKSKMVQNKDGSIVKAVDWKLDGND